MNIVCLRKSIFLIFASLILSATGIFYSYAANEPYPAAAEDLSGKKYFPRVKEALQSAKSSIFMVMYFVTFDPKDQKSQVSQLVEELVNARKRGVKVKVILDQNINFPAWEGGKGEWGREEKNDPLFVYLKKHGIEAYYDNLYTITHAKAIIIDEETVILGSANWTESSLRKNWEISCLIRSKELAKELLQDFSEIGIDNEASILDEERSPPIRLSQAFLTDPSLAPRMLTASDQIAFDLYLILLKKFDGNPQHMIEMDYKTLRHALGIDEKLSYASARDKMKQALRRLEENYRLIIRKKRFFMNTLVRLLNYPAKTPYSPPREQYCSIPDKYWSYGWHKIFSFPEKYCYLINLSRTSSNASRSWPGYITGLAKQFSISSNTLWRGMQGLRKLNIIEMEYPDYPQAGGYKRDEPIRFRLLGLYSTEFLKKEKIRLAELYGEERFKKAAGYAEIVYKGNDIQVIEDIIKKTDEYGPDQVDRAFKIVSEKSAANRKRSYKYVVGILQGEAEKSGAN